MRETFKTIRGVRNAPNFSAYLALLAVCFFWGTTWVASTYTVRQGVPALQVVALRQLIAGSSLFIVMMFYHRGKIAFPSWKSTFFLAIINFVCSNGISTWGVQYLPAGFASIIGATYPLWLVIIYYFFFKKDIAKLVWLGMLVSFIGLVFVFLPNITGATMKENLYFGLALSIFSSITWAIGNIYTKKQNEQNVNPYFSLSLQMLISGVILYSTLGSMQILVPISSIKIDVWYGIFYLVVAGSMIAYVCFLYALKHLPAEQVSIYAYVNPMVALFISNIFMGEKVTAMLLFGTVIVLAGLYILNKAFRD